MVVFNLRPYSQFSVVSRETNNRIEPIMSMVESHKLTNVRAVGACVMNAVN